MISNVIIQIAPAATVAVATTSTLLLAANKRRTYAILINTSATDVWVMLGSAATVSGGIYLVANGGSYEINRLNLWQGDIFAIHGASGTKAVNVLEGQ